MALCLIIILIQHFTGINELFLLAVFLLVVNMTVPSLFKPVGVLWYGGSALIGGFMSKILLSIVFLILVTPVGMIRRLMGKDSLNLRAWKKDNDSVFQKRHFQYGPDDLNTPY